jgi:hypothetical protein
MNQRAELGQSTKKLGAFLEKMQLVSKADMKSVLDDLAGLDADLPFILERRGLVDEQKVAETIASVFKLPLVREVLPSNVLTDLNAITVQDMERYRLLPIGYDQKESIPNLKVVMSNPFNLVHCQALSKRMTIGISIGVSSIIKQTVNTLLSRVPAPNLERQVLAQLIDSGLVTSAQVEFATQVINGQQRKPLIQTGSNQSKHSEEN